MCAFTTLLDSLTFIETKNFIFSKPNNYYKYEYFKFQKFISKFEFYHKFAATHRVSSLKF